MVNTACLCLVQCLSWLGASAGLLLLFDNCAAAQTLSCLELDLNEAALSITLVKFAAWPQEGWVLAVGTVQSLTFYPREVKDGFIRLYRCLHAWLAAQLLRLCC